MSTNVHAVSNNNDLSLIQLTEHYDAMQIAQLCAFAFSIPQLYFCREYLAFDEPDVIKECQSRLNIGLKSGIFTLTKLQKLASEKDFYDSEEARLRLAPEPL